MLYCVKPVNCHQRERASERGRNRLTEGGRERLSSWTRHTASIPQVGVRTKPHTHTHAPSSSIFTQLPSIGKNNTDSHSHFIYYAPAGKRIDPAYIYNARCNTFSNTHCNTAAGHFTTHTFKFLRCRPCDDTRPCGRDKLHYRGRAGYKAH